MAPDVELVVRFFNRVFIHEIFVVDVIVAWAVP